MGNSANKSANLNLKDEQPGKTSKSKEKAPKKRRGFFRRSKTKGLSKKVKVDKIPPTNSYDLVAPEKEVDPDEYNLSRIRKSLVHDLETFLLNNILMSVQFFDNFEREVGTLRVSPISDEEIDRNFRLASYQKHCVSPDKLHEVVSRRVRFRPQYGPKKHCTEYIQTPRLLVVQDNVELYEGTDDEYNAVGPIYRLTMEGANVPGYVKLRYDDKRRPTYDTIVEKRKPEEEPNYSRILGEIPTPRGSDETAELLQEEEEDTFPEETQTLTEGQRMMLALQEQIEGGKKDLSKSLNALNVDVLPTLVSASDASIYGTTKSTLFKRKFGPQSSSSEPMQIVNSETPTERRLSGLIKSTKPLAKFTAPIAVAKIQRKPQLPAAAAKSMPNLTEGLPTSPQASTRGSPQSDSSGYKSGSSSYTTTLSLPNSRGSDVDYGYATIKNYVTPKPLEQLRLGKIPSNSSTIPEECFLSVDVKLINKDEGKRKSQNGTYIIPDKLFETRFYLKSTSFAASFADVFAEGLAMFLGISPETIEAATMQGSQIFYDTLEEGPNLIPLKIHHSVIPTITSTSWPIAAFEWPLRQRKCITDRNVAYTWPTQRMVAKVKSFGCHVFPEGFMPPRGENPDHRLEWGLAFPEAERYLESCLTHAQVRCFMFTLAMYKNFMEPMNSELGLSTGNIRSLLLWQCEKNYAAWPEDRPGETLRKFLSILYDALMKESLPDYFVRSRNQLDGIPRTHIRRVQEKLCRVRENLIMHVMTMTRNLRYVDEDNFYPRLDYQRLYAIVTTENIVALVNPSLARSISQQIVADSDPEEDSSDDDSGTGMWAEARKMDPGRQWIKKVNRQIVAEKAAQKLTNEFKRKSVDSIDIQIIPGQHTEAIRRQMLLEVLIPHFIAMAKRSNEFRASKQSMLYIVHAERLTKLLGELTHNSSAVRKLHFEIKCLRQSGMINMEELRAPQSVQTYKATRHSLRPPESPTAKITMDLPPIPSNPKGKTKPVLEKSPPRTPEKRPAALKRIDFVLPNENTKSSGSEIVTSSVDKVNKTVVIESQPSIILDDVDFEEESTDF